MKRVSVLLITLALIAGVVGCPADPEPTPPVEYSLTIASSEGGEVTTPGEGSFTYEEGTMVSLVAEAQEGHRFINWTGDVATIVDADAAETTITMSGEYWISVNFVPQYALTIDNTAGGSVIVPGEGTFIYDCGTIVPLVAEAEDGYKFLHWTGDVDTAADVAAASTTITMQDACAVTANFVPEHIYVDKIGPGLWSVDAYGEGIEAIVTDEGVVVNFPSHLLNDPQVTVGGGGYSLDTLKGDFDIRMGYELITWPQHSGMRVGLIVLVGDRHAPDHMVNVERTGFGEPDLDFHFPGEPPEVYLVNFDDEVLGITGTDDVLGALRVTRRGEMVTGYYQTSEGWHEIYKAEWSTEDARIKACTWTSGYVFGGEEVSVFLRTVEVVESAP